ncbi:MAG: RNA polymerase sigma-54 factor, partial [Firmicutes bacterium]|nr:RNA polymerase sigma-54 factor [Bacillota bacterium]
MRLGYELTIEQTQKLSMTPELIQAIQILQLNQQELAEYVENELLENPVLEIERTEDSNEVDLQAVVLQSAA